MIALHKQFPSYQLFFVVVSDVDDTVALLNEVNGRWFIVELNHFFLGITKHDAEH
jgi:hypothetical protein